MTPGKATIVVILGAIFLVGVGVLMDHTYPAVKEPQP